MPRKRIDEWIAFDAFYNVVTTTLGLTIDDYEQLENDPPDFLFAIDGRQYGAEVTQVCDGSQRPFSQFKKFCSTLEKLAGEYSLQLGAWRCMMRGSPAIPNVNTRKGRREIRAVLEELRNLQFDSVKSEFSIGDKSDGEIVFARIRAHSEFGTLLSSMSFAEFSCETRLLVLEAIREACTRKLKALQNKGFPASNCVLLLFDSYAFSEEREILEDTRALSEFEDFHSVAWVRGFASRENVLKPQCPGRFCTILWSRNKSWLNQ